MIQQTSSKLPALARVFRIHVHLLEVCWPFAGSCKHPIRRRVVFKMATLVYPSLSDMAPAPDCQLVSDISGSCRSLESEVGVGSGEKAVLPPHNFFENFMQK